MSGIPNQPISVNRPATANFDIDSAFDKSVAIQNSHLKKIDDLQNVGFMGKVGDFFVPSRVKNREDQVELYRSATQLIADIRQKMAEAVSKTYEH